MSWKDRAIEVTDEASVTEEAPVAAPSQPEKKAAPKRSKTSEALSALMGLARGATMGFAKDIGAPVFAATAGVPLDVAQREVEQLYSRGETDNPGLTTLGRLAGGLATTGPVPGGPIASGSIVGGLTALGESPDRLNAVDETLLGAGLGAAGGAAAKYLPQGIAAVRGAAAEKKAVLSALVNRLKGVPDAVPAPVPAAPPVASQAATLAAPLPAPAAARPVPDALAKISDDLTPEEIAVFQRHNVPLPKRTRPEDLMDIGADFDDYYAPRKVVSSAQIERQLADVNMSRDALSRVRKDSVDSATQALMKSKDPQVREAATLVTGLAKNEPTVSAAAHHTAMATDPKYRTAYNAAAEKAGVFTKPTSETLAKKGGTRAY